MSKSLRILLAEDEYIFLMSLKSDLEDLGHQVVEEALDGKEAVELAIEKKPDLILMDINMPSLDGIEAIKQINNVLSIPAIIITGYSNKELVKRATDVGIFGYLVKPVDIKEIGPAIDVALTRFQEYQAVKEELDDTKEALESRKYIERAKGILMDRKNISEPEAMKLLQKKSNDTNTRLVVIAKDIIKADEALNF
jgi:response regulator NasT